jgi:hypothetical protein
MIAKRFDKAVYFVVKLGGKSLPPLTVPQNLRKGIVRIGELPESTFQQLLGALSRAPECKDRKQLSSWIGDETPDLSSTVRDEILAVLTSMLRVQRTAAVTPRQFAEDVWGSLSDSAPKSVSKVDGLMLQSRIASLLEKESLDTSLSRVNESKNEVERNFCRVKVLTDIRAAFRSDASIPPMDMAVIHNFQFGYHDGMGKHHEFYVSLDGGDLKALKAAVLEAEKRAETLEKMLAAANINLHK